MCEEAHCPNIGECWGHQTATFMLLGDTCTRNCAFCAVTHGRPLAVDPDEPRRVAEAVARLGLRHVVVTSVNRDDLADGGAGHFAATARAIKARLPDVPGRGAGPGLPGRPGRGRGRSIASPIDIFNHNVETVPRLYKRVRPGAQLRAIARRPRRGAPSAGRGCLTKAGLMLGLGETSDGARSVFSATCATSAATS